MNRHSSLGKFVQKHKNKAEIRITLGNKGDDPYNQEVYGDKIVFARNIYSNGSSAQVIRHGENYKVLKKGSKLLKFFIVAIILNIYSVNITCIKNSVLFYLQKRPTKREAEFWIILILPLIIQSRYYIKNKQKHFFLRMITGKNCGSLLWLPQKCNPSKISIVILKYN